ncbi:hypothetical protein JFV29_00405 [Peribacillus sp. TH16]|nr:hypothetical protein [Peribacillus sp. TH16]
MRKESIPPAAIETTRNYSMLLQTDTGLYFGCTYLPLTHREIPIPPDAEPVIPARIVVVT